METDEPGGEAHISDDSFDVNYAVLEDASFDAMDLRLDADFADARHEGRHPRCESAFPILIGVSPVLLSVLERLAAERGADGRDRSTTCEF